MNIVTAPLPMNLNTANVHTEAAKTDNQKKELIPQVTKPQGSAAESKLAGDADKAKLPGQTASENQTVFLSDEANNKKIAEDQQNSAEQQSDQEQPEQEQKDQSEQDQKDQQQASQKKQQDENQQAIAKNELEQITQLKSRDTEVRQHEHAHASVGGQHAGSPSYDFERGPDGANYAVAGEVPIDVSEIAGDPQATIEKMQQVQAAALAPAEPSGADRAIAADAAQKIATAQAELVTEKSATQQSEESEDSTLASDEEKLEASDNKQAKAKSEPPREQSIDERATRIANFYQAATSPFEASRFAGQI